MQTIESIGALCTEYLNGVPKTENIGLMDSKILFILRAIITNWWAEMVLTGTVDLTAEERAIFDAYQYLIANETLNGFDSV